MRTQQNTFLYSFNIGSNNTTKKRELKKAQNILKENEIKGFNIVLNKGFWIDKNKTYEEKSFIINVISNKENPLNDNKAIFLKLKLERELKQFLIILTKQKAYKFLCFDLNKIQKHKLKNKDMFLRSLNLYPEFVLSYFFKLND